MREAISAADILHSTPTKSARTLLMAEEDGREDGEEEEEGWRQVQVKL